MHSGISFPKSLQKVYRNSSRAPRLPGTCLLANIKAQDQEDGDITKDIRILGIKYQRGRLQDGQKQEAYEVRWKNGMPDDKKLDTWFLELDDKDAPVEHQIITV